MISSSAYLEKRYQWNHCQLFKNVDLVTELALVGYTCFLMVGNHHPWNCVG